MLSRLLEAHELIISRVRQAITATAANRDDGTNDMLIDSASAANAPSLATVRIRMTVERSTSHCPAASAIVTSWRTSCNQISYFCNGVKNRLPRRPARSVPRSGTDMIGWSSTRRGDPRMLLDSPADLYREVRRKPLSGSVVVFDRSLVGAGNRAFAPSLRRSTIV
jgi:hypothetical protein